MAMLELCNNLMNMTRKRITDLMIRIDSQTGKPEVQCFMYAIKDFMQKERQKAEYKSVPVTQPATPTLPPDLDPAIAALLQSGQVTPEMLRNYGYEEFIPYLSAAEAVNNNATINALQPFPKYPPDWNPDFPMTKDNMKVLIDNNPQIYTDPLDSNYTNWLEIALGYWITNGYTMTRTTDWFTYAGILGEEKFSYSLPVSLVNGQFYGTRLKYAAIVVNTTLDRRIVRYTDGLQYFQRWESFVNDMNANMPSGLNNAFFVVNGRNIYLHLKMGKSMVYQAIYGLCLGIALACPVLIMGTKNIIIGLMATFTILLSTTCVVGMIPVAGWKLGTMVSLNLCLVIGLSVDYTVHLAEGYAYAPYDDRKARTYFMFDEVGLPVTAGAVTTLGASLFMLFAEMQFLVQFGSFMFCTIGCSLLFSLTFLSTMMANIGPQRNEGNVTKWFSNCRNRKLNPQDRP
ncbi:protein patched homolog 1-like [Tubulanus polymorphus]|uniref:protein patched homolog 1-like n=1 Tax=Tubulanus polymorphus TaxID=672921 RepID=UPI003DA5682F